MAENLERDIAFMFAERGIPRLQNLCNYSLAALQLGKETGLIAS